jgi:hypothetical protein
MKQGHVASSQSPSPFFYLIGDSQRRSGRGEFGRTSPRSHRPQRQPLQDNVRTLDYDCVGLSGTITGASDLGVGSA